MEHEAINKLTARQRDCLRLVLHHMQSKEIGRELGISPMTVDNHFRSAIQTLGVSNRLEAARMLEAFERDAGSQRLTSQPHPVVFPPGESTMASPTAVGDGRDEVSHTLHENQVPYRIHGGTSFPDFPLPVPTRGRPRNDLTIAQRLFWISVLIGGMGLGTGALLSGFATLSDIILALRR